MNILFLGYDPYLSHILIFLKDTAFFLENQIDVILADPPPLTLKNRFFKSLLSQNQTMDLPHLKQQVRHYHRLSQQYFPSIDLRFLTAYPAIRRLPYAGLEQFPDLSGYDYLIVASYAHKIPAALFKQPKYGTLNIHPSYLPNLRGGYPTYIQAFDPQQKLGTTLHRMTEDWDEGDIVLQVSYEADRNAPLTNEAILALSAQYAARLLNELHHLEFHVTPQKQDPKLVTVCRNIMRRKHKLETIEHTTDFEGYLRANHDRHLFPHTYTLYQDRLFIILAAQEIRPTMTMRNWPERTIMLLGRHYYLRIEQQVYQVTHFVFDSAPHT